MKKLLQSFIIGGALLLFLGTGSAQAAETIILSEDFAEITTGNSTSSTGSNSAWAGNDNFPTVDRAYQAGGAVKLGASGNLGSITSMPLDLSVNEGAFKVKLKIKGWTTVEGDIQVTPSGITPQTATYSAVMSSTAFQEVEFSFKGGQANTTIQIATTAKRAYIDEVVVYYGELDCTPSGLAFAEATVSKTTADANFTFTPTSNSTAAITYASSNAAAATVNATSGEVTIVGVGATTITASQATDGTYCAADATYTLTVGFDPDDLTEFELVTGDSQLIVDGEYIIVAKRSETEYVALGRQNTSNRPAVVVTTSDDNASTVLAPIATEPRATADGADGVVYKLQLGGEAGAWTLKDIVYETILGPSTSTADDNHLKANATALFSITILEDGTAEMICVEGGHESRNTIRYNTSGGDGAGLFACYESGQQPVYLYTIPDNATTTISPSVDQDDVVAYKYYNLQGQEVNVPQAGAFYVVKNIHASGKVSVTKEFKK